MFKSSAAITLATTFIFMAVPAYAEVADGVQKDLAQEVATQAHQGRGRVNKVDADAGKTNITHEAIKSLKWPKMTMDFTVQDKSALAGIKPGMQVEFELAKFGSGYRITSIVPARQ